MGHPSSLRGPVAGEFPGVKPGALDADLLSALDRREIEVLFQPQFSCATGALVGAEALARWQHPTLGEIGARDLFAIAERAALVAPLSRHVVARALEGGVSLGVLRSTCNEVRHLSTSITTNTHAHIPTYKHSYKHAHGERILQHTAVAHSSQQ